MKNPPCSSLFRAAQRTSVPAFTLVELIGVLAIIAILTALTLPSISGTMRAYQLETAGQSVINQLSLARQTAASVNQPVEVRFYYLPDYSQSSTSSPSVYRGMQCFIRGTLPASGNPTLTPTTKPYYFSAPITLSTGSHSFSPLLAASPAAPTTTDPNLPIYQANYKYSAFHFKPDGSTDLIAPNNSVTLTVENAVTGANGLPANYVTIEIEPTIGSVRAFRP